MTITPEQIAESLTGGDNDYDEELGGWMSLSAEGAVLSGRFQHDETDETTEWHAVIVMGEVGAGPDNDDELTADERLVYEHLRGLGCTVAVDGADSEDCASVAVSVVAALRSAGRLAPVPVEEVHEPGPFDGGVRYCEVCHYVWPCKDAPAGAAK